MYSTRKVYTADDKDRAIALANKIGVVDASFYLNMPSATLYGWLNDLKKTEQEQGDVKKLNTPDDDRIFVTQNLWRVTNESINEFRKQLVDLKAAVEMLTDVIVKEIEAREKSNAVSCKN